MIGSCDVDLGYNRKMPVQNGACQLSLISTETTDGKTTTD